MNCWSFVLKAVLCEYNFDNKQDCNRLLCGTSFTTSSCYWSVTWACSLWEQAKQKALCCKCARKPKLFFVSTSSTTTTLQTASLCYATSGTTIGTCTGRKRRSINIEGVPLADVKPSQLNQEVQSSQEDQLDREGRFLLYWITTTSVSTSTSFTTTVSISGKVICTTSGIVGVNVCGKWFWWFPPPWYPPPPSARLFTAPLVWIVQTEEWPLVDQPKQPMWYTICF